MIEGLGGGPNLKSHVKTSSESLKEVFFMGQRYRKMEDQKPWPGVGKQLGTRSRKKL